MTQHTKNLLLAAALSLAFIGIWDHFYAFPQMDKQRAQVIEQQRVTWCEMIRLVAMPVRHLAGQHIDELRALVLERRIGGGVLVQRDQIRLHHHRAAGLLTKLRPWLPPSPRQNLTR